MRTLADTIRDRLLGLADPATEGGRLRRSAATAFLVRVASAALLYATQIVLARWMGASEYGVYVMVWTWVLVLGGLSHLGLSMVMMRMLPAYVETGDLATARGLVSGGRLFALANGTLVAATGLALLVAAGDRVGAATFWPAVLALACIPLYALTDVQDGIGRGRGWMAAALVPPYILRPALVLAGMFVAHEAGLPMAAATAAGAAVMATWLAALVQTAAMRRRLAGELPAGPKRYAFRHWLSVGAPLMVVYGAELVLQNADVLLLAMYRPAADVGMYFAAAKTMALVMFVHYAVGSAAGHRFSTLHARGDRDGVVAAVREAVRWTFWPSFVVAIALLGLGRPLLWLFSPEFTAAYPVMVVLVAGFLARAAVGPAEFLLNMLGEQRAVAGVAVASAVANVVLNLALIPRFGLMGAATATSAALVFAAVAHYALARRRLGLDIAIWRNM